MDDILSVAELIEVLQGMPPEAKVMVAVVKYPAEFALRRGPEGELTWMDSTDTEVIPLERGEITLQGPGDPGQVIIAAELTDYDALRHFAGG